MYDKKELIRHVNDVIGRPDFMEGLKSDVLLMRCVWVGVLSEFFPEVTLVEWHEYSHLQSRTVLNSAKHDWNKMPWQTRFAWLKFFEASCMALEVSPIIRGYTRELATFKEDAKKHAFEILDKQELLRDWQKDQTQARWKSLSNSKPKVTPRVYTEKS